MEVKDTTAAGTAGAKGAADAGGGKGGTGETTGNALDVDVQALGQDGAKGAAAKDADKNLTPEAKAAAEKTAADEKAKADAAAAKVEVKFGDLQVDEKLAGKFSEAAKAAGLDSAKAQQLADVYVEARKAEDAQLKAALEQQNKTWQEQLRADKEIGGASYDASIVSARKALTKFGPELAAELKTFGLSNLPSLVKMLARIGKADAEDSLGEGAHGAGGRAQTRQEELKARYPTMSNGR